MLSLGYETSVNKVGRGGTGRGRGQLRMKALFGLRRGKINHRKKICFSVEEIAQVGIAIDEGRQTKMLQLLGRGQSRGKRGAG